MKQALTASLMIVLAAVSLTSCDKIKKTIASLGGNQSVNVASLSQPGSDKSQKTVVSLNNARPAEVVKNAEGFPIYFKCDVKESMSASDKDGTKDVWVDRLSSFTVLVAKTDKGLSATINNGGRISYSDGFIAIRDDWTRFETVQISDIELKIEANGKNRIHEGEDHDYMLYWSRSYSIDRVSGKVKTSAKNDWVFKQAPYHTDHGDLILAEGDCKVVNKKF